MNRVGLVICALFLLPGLLLAEDKLVVVGFDDDFVEARVRGKIVDLEPTELGEPPFLVLAKDNHNFLKIKNKNGEEIWLSGSYVKTSDFLKFPKNCRSMLIAQSADKQQRGVRGAGEACQ